MSDAIYRDFTERAAQTVPLSRSSSDQSVLISRHDRAGTHRILAAGCLRLHEGSHTYSFAHGGETLTVTLDTLARDAVGRLIAQPAAGALTPGYDNVRDLGGARVHLQFEAEPVDPRGVRSPAFVLHYEVSVPAEQATTLRAA